MQRANELDIGPSKGPEEELNFRQGYASVSHSRQRYASTGYRQYIESVLRRQASRPQRPASLCFLSVKDMVQVTRLAFGLMVKVVSHGTDRYGRILGDIFLPDGSMLNECLVEEGWAWHYTRYSNNPRFN
jgi:hypothetical protein